MVTLSNILAWEIPWIEETGRLVHGVTKSWTGLSMKQQPNLLSTILKVESRMAGNLRVIYPPDHMVFWEPWLPQGQHQERASRFLSLAEKISKVNIQGLVSTTSVWFAHHHAS